MTLNEVTVATRIPPRFLEAFEREDWEKLPGGVFNRGFVRAIARYLGLDEEQSALGIRPRLRRATRRGPSGACRRSDSDAPKMDRSPLRFHYHFSYFVCGIIWGSVYGWRRYAARRAAKRAALSASVIAPATGPATPSPTTPAVASRALPTPKPPPANPSDPTANPSGTNSANPPPSQRLDLAVSTSGPTRVRVVADGRIVLDSRLPAGETRRLFAKNQFVISAAHPEAVLLEMNGQAMPSLTSAGPSGTMVLSQKDLRQAPSGNAQR